MMRVVAAHPRGVGLALWVALIFSILYGSTLMVGFSGCASEYCLDVGEFQIALARWGTVHHTGYPLYMQAGSPFVAALHGLGVPYTAGASIFSLVWQVIALSAFALLLARLTLHRGLAFGATLVLGATEPFWIHGALAEVYSFSMALLVAGLWLTFDLRERWSDARGWLLAFVLGLGVSHHRLLVLLLPIAGLFLLPVAPRGVRLARWAIVAGVCFALAFLPYLDMVWRAQHNASWLYSRLDTWDQFWFLFRGEEVAGLQRPTFEPGTLLTSAGAVLAVHMNELTPLGVVVTLAGAGLGLLRPRVRPPALVFVGLWFVHSLFATVMRQAVLLEATLMGALLAAVALASLGLSTLPGRARTVAVVALTGLAVFLGARNYPALVELTRDPAAAIFLHRFSQLDAPPDAVVMLPWGSRFFALRYAQLVEGQYRQWRVVDHRANFAELAQTSHDRIYTAQETLFAFSRDWWAQQLGEPLRVSSAGPGLVRLSAQPLPPALSREQIVGDGIAVADWSVRESESQLSVTVQWAASHPVTTDYSTFVHATDKDDITAPEDLIAGSDSGNAVYGWYPTSLWQPNELIREDHTLTLPPDRPVRTLFVGLYSRGADGSFVTLGRVRLQKIEGGWVRQP